MLQGMIVCGELLDMDANPNLCIRPELHRPAQNELLRVGVEIDIREGGGVQRIEQLLYRANPDINGGNGMGHQADL